KKITTAHYDRLPAWARAAVDAEEEWHRWTTGWSSRLNEEGFLNAVLRVLDEMGAKTWALGSVAMPWKMKTKDGERKIHAVRKTFLQRVLPVLLVGILAVTGSIFGLIRKDGRVVKKSMASSVHKPYRMRHAYAEDFALYRAEIEEEVERAGKAGREIVFVLEM